MLNNQDFTSLERRLWREGNPLCDELVSTRDTLFALIKQSQEVLNKYSPLLNSVTQATALDYMREWDNFGDTLDNLTYDLGE
jgi:hypothetical protein